MAASFKEKSFIYNSSDISSSRPLVSLTQSGPHEQGVVASHTEDEKNPLHSEQFL